MKELRTRSLSDGQRTENTPQAALTASNLRAVLKKLSITPIWRANAEPKCKVFAGILLHRKILITGNLERRGWPHDPLRKLCNSAPETPTHTCAVWIQVVKWFGLQQLLPSNSTSTIYQWWKRCRKVFSKEQKSTFDGLMMYFWWNI
jgi:hypothetical protein